MRFESIEYAYLFALIPIFLLMLAWASRRRKKLLGEFAEAHLLPHLTGGVDFWGKKAKYWLSLGAIIMFIVALMGPQWGFEWQEVTRHGVDIVFAIDTSRSMLATDVKPNRLERTKLAVLDVLPNLRGDRVGLVAFAGTSFLQVPLTLDYSAFAMGLQSLSVDTIPVGGTALAHAIETAIKAFEPVDSSKVLVIISDGEDHSGNLQQVLKKAKEAGIVVHTIGIGTSEGELIPLMDEYGNVEYLKDKEGRVVKTRLDEKTLRDLALGTGGAYVHATPTQFGLDLIYSQKITEMQTSEFQSTLSKRYESRYQWPLLVGFILLCAEMLISEGKRNGMSVYRQFVRRVNQHINGGSI